MNSNKHSLSSMPMMDHMRELKTRLIWVVLVFAAALAVCLFFADHIFAFLVQPLAGVTGPNSHRMIYTGLAEGFLTFLNVALFAAFCLSFPFLAYQIWLFIKPALYRHEQSGWGVFFVAAPILFVMGAALAYYAVIPLTWSFFLSFEQLSGSALLPIKFEARISEYLAFTIQFITVFGLTFQLPLVLLLLARLGIVTGAQLSAWRRYAVIVIFLGAAVFTPSPDIIAQLAMAVPLYILFEITILLIKQQESTGKTDS